MASKHLFAANELGIFEALADAPADLTALAARTGLTTRAARISVDAMVALGFVERTGDLYRNGDAAQTFLAGRPGPDLRPYLRLADEILYPTFEALAQALGSGPPREVFELDEAKQQVLSAGIEAILAGPAAALGHAVDVSDRRRLLDVGGGTGSWTIALARLHAHLHATILDVRTETAVERVLDADLSDRVDVSTADVLADELPGGYDVFLVSNLVHYWSPETNIDLLQRIRRVAPTGALLLLVDFWTDPTHTQPVEAALMAGNFAVNMNDGDVYSVEEVTDWLAQSGWHFDDHRPLHGPQSVIVAHTA
jgi:SAM-dependent methyltransferase